MLKAAWDFNTRLSESVSETCEALYVKLHEMGNVVERKHGKRPDMIKFGSTTFADRFIEIMDRWDKADPRYFKPEHDATLNLNQVHLFLNGECVVDLNIANFDESF